MGLPGSLLASGRGDRPGVGVAPALAGCMLELWVGEGDETPPRAPWGYAAADRPVRAIAIRAIAIMKAEGLMVYGNKMRFGDSLELNTVGKVDLGSENSS